MLARFTIPLVCLFVLSAPVQTRAQTPVLEVGSAETPREPIIQVQARSASKIAATHGQDPTASGTSIDLTDRVTMPRMLGDVVRESPGAQVQSTGGIGAFASLSLRGAAGDETLVLLDEIPLSTADGGAFDLSLFPAELFDQANVFRGGAPVWLGSGAIGGVLQLIPHRGGQNRSNLSLGMGSFGTYQANAGVEVATKRGISAHSQLVVRSTQGNYPYRDDNSTLLSKVADDHTFRMKNADFMEASGIQDLTVPLWGGTLHTVVLGLQRGGGFPSSAVKPTPLVRRESSRLLAATGYTLEGGTDERFRRKLQLLASTSYVADRWTDLYQQLGTGGPSARDNRSARVFTRAAGSLALTRWLESTWVSSYSYDHYRPRDALARVQPNDSQRHSAANALELAAKGSLGPIRFELRPSARIEWSRTELSPSNSFTQPLKPRTVLARTARIGGVIAPLSWLALSGSIATGTRVPTIFELFGDGGLVLPNIALKPVTSTTYDGGLSLKGRAGVLRGRLETRAFWQARRDSIVLITTAQHQAIYQNVATVHQKGVESSLSGSVSEFLRLTGSYTWLEAENGLHKRLPMRPRNIAYVRPEARVKFDTRWLSGASVSSELWHRSFTYYDVANTAANPACTKLAFGAALAFLAERIRFSARMDDSLDARCTDLLGYPLSGRSLFFSLSYQEVEDENS